MTELYGYGDIYFEKFIKMDLKNLEKSINEIVSGYHIDLIHSQNAPDFLTVAAIRAVKDVPIIHDNQDAISLRKTPYYPGADMNKQLNDEQIANECCDARIHVTEELKAYVEKKYGRKMDVVFYNYVSESLMPSSFKEKLSDKDGQVHIVYEGTLASLQGDHYDLKSIFKAIASHSMNIHIYDSHSNDDYRRLAETDDFIHYHGHLDPRDLLDELTQYDFGWAGFNVAMNKPHMDVALPNKAFEYIACCLPILSYPHKAQKKFIKEHGVGLVFEGIDEIPKMLTNTEALNEIRKSVLKKRFEFTVERNIRKITNFYDYVLEN